MGVEGRWEEGEKWIYLEEIEFIKGQLNISGLQDTSYSS